MRLAFVDIAYGYTADRPDMDAPLGGTTSAVCFLAREMVKAGITCDFFNTVSEDGMTHGIRSLPLERLIMELGVHTYDGVIFCGRWMEGMVRLVRQATQAPLVAWMHESVFNPKLVPAVDVFDGIVFVSEWQQKMNQEYLPAHWKQAVIRNAMNPLAANLFANGKISENKAKPPVILYAGAAARGVFHVAPILELVRAKHVDYAAQIFCNTNPSGDVEQDRKYIGWLRHQPHVMHVGMVGQAQLIQHMKHATLMLAPNPWPETSCISMIEAMAAGLSVITTNRAALPETASGYAHIIPIENAGDPLRFDMAMPHSLFAEAILACLDEKASSKNERLQAQITFFNQNYQWFLRVPEWHSFIEGMQKC